MSGAHSGITMTERIPRRWQWNATASPWLPALAATTPRLRSTSERVRSLFAAPRSLKEPVIWRFSSLTKQRLPGRRGGGLGWEHRAAERAAVRGRGRAASTAERDSTPRTLSNDPRGVKEG